MSVMWKLILAMLLGVLMCEVLSASDPLGCRPHYPFWGTPWRATTPVESILRGHAALIEAQGQASLYDSLAAKNYQDAYKQSLENQALRTEVYFARKEIAKQYSLKYAEKPRNPEEVKRLAKLTAPKRLSPEQYDPLTAKLQWPHVLRRSEYDAVRQKIDTLMSLRTPEDSGDGSPSHTKIRQCADLMKLLLKENMDTVTPQQFANALAFLVSLEVEARHALSE
jgi:hypothetical protein